MADNVVADPGSGGATFAADDITSVYYPRMKITLGADGVNDGDVASGNPMPISATALTTLATVVKAEDAASAGGDAGVVVMAMRQDTPAAVSGTDGDYEPLRVVAGKLAVDASLTTLTVASHAVTNAGTFAVQAASAGDIAHDSADSGNPVKTGGKATTSLAGITLVADADRTNFFAGVDGVQIIRNHCNLENIVSGNASNTDGTSTEVLAAGAAGVKHYLTRVTLTNTSATMAYVEIKDGTTVKHTIPVPATGGATVAFDPPLPGTAATAWNFDPSAAITTMICSVIGFKSKV